MSETEQTNQILIKTASSPSTRASEWQFLCIIPMTPDRAFHAFTATEKFVISNFGYNTVHCDGSFGYIVWFRIFLNESNDYLNKECPFNKTKHLIKLRIVLIPSNHCTGTSTSLANRFLLRISEWFHG